jgi:hypothetical protein
MIPLESPALNAEIQHFVLSFSVSYWDLIKFPYFTDISKRGVRGWKEAQRQGDFADFSNTLATLTHVCQLINFEDSIHFD